MDTDFEIFYKTLIPKKAITKPNVITTQWLIELKEVCKKQVSVLIILTIIIELYYAK